MMPNKIGIENTSFADLPVLTIVIATYNAAVHIEGCLNSILSNVKFPHQVIIVDGVSTDSTLEMLDKFRSNIHVLISEKDKGIYDAMNKAIPFIEGKWVLFLGADDRILPSIGQMHTQLIDENTIYYGNCTNEANLGGRAFSNYKLAKMSICHQSILYPNGVFSKYSYNLKYPVFADYALNMQCWGDCNFNKKYFNIDIAYFNMEGFSSFAEDKAFRRDKPMLIKKFLGKLVYWRYLLKKFRESHKPGSEFF